MQIGQQVYYRLTAEDSANTGARTEQGQLLPAIVLRPYNAAEKGFARGHDYISGTDRNLSFSGVADIKVLIPGDNDLFVPGAVEDTNCLANENMGHGITALPDYGMFTQSQPADLLS